MVGLARKPPDKCPGPGYYILAQHECLVLLISIQDKDLNPLEAQLEKLTLKYGSFVLSIFSYIMASAKQLPREAIQCLL